jgi:hypothetical protein
VVFPWSTWAIMASLRKSFRVVFIILALVHKKTDRSRPDF